MARPRTGKHTTTTYKKKKAKQRANENLMTKFMRTKRQKLNDSDSTAVSSTSSGEPPAAAEGSASAASASASAGSASAATSTSATSSEVAAATVASATVASAAAGVADVQGEADGLQPSEKVDSASGAFVKRTRRARREEVVDPSNDDDGADWNASDNSDDDSRAQRNDSPGSLADLMEIADYSLAEHDSGTEMDLPEESQENIPPEEEVVEEVITLD